MAYDRWDVVLSTFPFVERSGSKLRPILVLSTARFNGEHGVVVGAMITTASGGRWSSDHEILDLPAAGLKRTSVVRWKVFTLPADVLARRIGRLSQQDRAQISELMRTIFLAGDAD